MLIRGIIIVGKTIHIGDSRINFSQEKSKEIQQWQKVNKGIVGAVLIILLQIQSAG